MTATKTLHETGQSIWLDSISRELLESGTLARYARPPPARSRGRTRSLPTDPGRQEVVAR